MTASPFVLEDTTERILRRAADAIRRGCGERIGDMVGAALARTLTETVTFDDRGRAFVITGDIPAMWLRDSTTQLTPYLRFIRESPQLADLVAAVVRRQFGFIAHDSYANAFNDGPTGARYDPEDVCEDPNIWEQKYEVDSVAYPVTLAHRLWHETGRTDVFDETTHGVFEAVVAQLAAEQDHASSPYRFERDTEIATETLPRSGRGSPVARTGMTWSGFRPSDDACTYGYNIPANLFAAQALRGIADVATEVWTDGSLAERAVALSKELVAGVAAHGVVPGPDGGTVYAYEVDGLGGVLRMDDANTPSLLSLPLIAPDVVDRDVWQRTRAFVLSDRNPFWYSGTALSGVGSPHTAARRVWPIALAIEGLTGSAAERRALLAAIAESDGGTGHIHEAVDVDDPTRFSRPWFSWAESMFCELALAVVDDAT